MLGWLATASEANAAMPWCEFVRAEHKAARNSFEAQDISESFAPEPLWGTKELGDPQCRYRQINEETRRECRFSLATLSFDRKARAAASLAFQVSSCLSVPWERVVRKRKCVSPTTIGADCKQVVRRRYQWLLDGVSYEIEVHDRADSIADSPVTGAPLKRDSVLFVYGKIR